MFEDKENMESKTNNSNEVELNDTLAKNSVEKENQNLNQSTDREIEIALPEVKINIENNEFKASENAGTSEILIENTEYETVQQNIPTIGNITSALRSDLKAQVETVLFVTDKPLKTGALAKTLNASYDEVQVALSQLVQEYEDRNGGLEIGVDDGYIIQVRTQYLNIVTEMMPLEISAGPLRTLSAVALKEPCLQSEVVDMRGSSAYEHINELVEMDLVSKKPQGQSYILKTTQKFKMYFRLSQEANQIKERLQEQAKRLAKQREEKKKEEEDQLMEQAREILEGPSAQKEEQMAG